MDQFALCFTAAVVALGLAAPPARAQSGALPSGAKVTITAVTQPNANFPQYTRVDVPLLRDGVAQRSNGRIEVKLSSWPEMNLSGPEIIRVVRSGQIDIGAASVNTVAGDVPFLDGIDLPGLLPDLAQARKVSDALIPVANKELERFNTRIVAIIPYSAQVLFCRQPVSGLADLKGRKVRSFSPSLNDFFTAIGAQPVTVNFAEVYGALERAWSIVARLGPAAVTPRAGMRWRAICIRFLSVGASRVTTSTCRGGTGSIPLCAPSWRAHFAR
jgi:TRAP-type C4-dicarboxylate transport system substrate-binding protein